MKKIICSILLFFGVTFLFAQINDGKARPSLGAFWNQGVNGKISEYIYYSVHTSGVYEILIQGKRYDVEVWVVDDPYTKILFADGNFSQRNRNWVTVYGEKIWNHVGSTQKFLASCNNRIWKIDSRNYANEQSFYQKTFANTADEKDFGCDCNDDLTSNTTKGNQTTIIYDIYRNQNALGSIDPSYINYEFNKQFQQDNEKRKTWFGRNWGWVVPTIIAVGVGTYYGIDALSNSNHQKKPIIEDPVDPEYFPGNENHFVPPKNGGEFVLFSF